MAKINDYPFEVRPLSDADGGGYLISFPDFAECISDGESVEEAVENGRDVSRIAVMEPAMFGVMEPVRWG